MPRKSNWPTPLAVRRELDRVGENLAAWRKLQGLTAAQVGDRAGVHLQTVLRLEGGDGGVSLENMLRIARALGLLDRVGTALDPYETDVGRLRSEQALPKRVRGRAGQTHG
jgi:transcriptional regulator with XRE-family HTH domain